jgi:hypothetical protein
MVRSMNELKDAFIPCPRPGALLVDRRRGAARFVVVVATQAGEG